MSLHFVTDNVDLRNETYYHMGGVARYFAVPSSFTEVRQALEFARSKNLPIAVLGTGSNSVFADGTFAGVVISLRALSAWVWERDDMLYVEGGVCNTEIAEVCLEAGRDGAAWMFRMPGQLGATIRMNARCYGGEISQIVYQVATIDVEGRIQTRSGKDIFRGYKDTLLMDVPEIVLCARLLLPNEAARASLLQTMEQCESDRHSKHHFDLPSCGSTFKNNYAVGKPSGRVFDELGLKGTKRGNVEVSQFHANFIWNTGDALTNDFLDLTAFMRETALTRANAALELEVQPIGAFAEAQFEACGMQKLGPHIDENGKKWVGLLWHPKASSKFSFPLTLLDAHFQSYMRAPRTGAFDIRARVEQLCSLAEAQKTPLMPFLKWTCLCAPHSQSEFSLSPKEKPGGFVDELWNFSVAEVFFAHGKKRVPYKEFEMTPASHWIALELDDKRKRRKGHEKPSEAMWRGRGVERFVASANEFGMTFSYEVLRELIDNNAIAMQSMLSLGAGRYLLAPHWKDRDTASETFDFTFTKPHAKPDFHQPERFWLARLA